MTDTKEAQKLDKLEQAKRKRIFEAGVPLGHPDALRRLEEIAK